MSSSYITRKYNDKLWVKERANNIQNVAHIYYVIQVGSVINMIPSQTA